MNPSGGSHLLAATRSALLDALEALDAHRDKVIVIGAQAVYLHTGAPSVALAEATKDSDLALDPRGLADEPLIERAMRDAGFSFAQGGQPGSWISSKGIPVDLMAPDSLAGCGRRSVEIPPHSSRAARRAVGLEAAVVDHVTLEISALSSDDSRTYPAKVAGPAALLVAKLHKLGERNEKAPERLADKDAHDMYRLLVAVPTEALARSMRALRRDDLAGQVTTAALGYLAELFAPGPTAVGSMMAGRAETGIGEPDTVSASVAALAVDLLSATSDG